MRIIFAGANVHPGDRAKWVWAGSTSCDSTNDATVVAIMDGESGRRVAGRFFFPAAGSLQLCYKFAYGANTPSWSGSHAAPTPYLLFPQIRTAVLTFQSVVPRGTAIGCTSTLSVHGAGFAALVDESEALLPSSPPGLRCAFGQPPAEPIFTGATIVSDALTRCASPTPRAAANFSMRVDYGSLTASHPDVLAVFGVFDATASAVSTVWPRGGGYNLLPTVELTGIFEDFGAPRCRFGRWVGDWGVVTANGTRARCRKPRLPDSERDVLGWCAGRWKPQL